MSTWVDDRLELDRERNLKNEIILFSESAKVTIVGQPEAQWKAQFCIFDKLKQEGWFGQEEGRLTSQITIPGILVGRVIGKGGVNVRELQVTKITKKGRGSQKFYQLTLLGCPRERFLAINSGRPREPA